MSKTGVLLFPLLVPLGLVALFFFALPLQANSQAAPHSAIVVSTLDDEDNADGDCSLREAIRASMVNQAVDGCTSGNSDEMDTITFAVAGTIVLTAQLEVAPLDSLLIDGGGAITLDGNHSVRVFYINNPGDLTLEGLTVTRGKSDDFGGGIYINLARVTIDDSTISDSTAFGPQGRGGGGGIYSQGELVLSNSTLSGNTSDAGGGIYIEDSTLTIDHTTFVNNTAGWAGGGGIYNLKGILNVTDSSFINNHASDSQNFQGPGGAINNGGYGLPGTATISGSIFSGNSAIEGGAMINWDFMTIESSSMAGNSATFGGSLNNFGTLHIIGTTLSGNNASGTGGAINNSGMLTIANSTLSANHSDAYGGGISNNTTMTVSSSALIGNSSYFNGGGIYNLSTWATATLSGSIIAYTPSGGNCDGDPVIDAGYNLEDTDACGFEYAKGSRTYTDPLLGPLQDNGGPTFTHALMAGSPAIDAGDPADGDLAACPATDQRGVARPLDGDGDGMAVCDIGAFEFVLYQFGIFLPVLSH